MNFKSIIYGLILLVSISSCQNNDLDLVFDQTPDVRMKAKLDSINKALISAPNGWKANVGTGLKGGYGFYFTFDDQQVVKMVGDLTNESMSTLQESNFRVKQDNGATLIFDTYNYITMLNHPDPSVFGGTIREGLRSDLEYRFKRSNADTMVFVGKRYANELVLVKASADEKAKYTSTAYLEAINQTKEFFNTNENPYIEFSEGGQNYQMGIAVALTNKTIEFASLEADKSTSAASGKYAFSLEGGDIINGGVKYRGITFLYLKWDSGKLYMVDDKGVKYELKNSATPILPLYKLIGSKYAGFRSPYLTYFPGTSEDGLTILKRFHEGLGNRATGYVFNSGYIDLAFDTRNKRVTFTGASSQSNGSSHWLTTIIYNYTLDDETGIYTITAREPASGGYTAVIMDQLNSFLLSSRIKFDYHSDNGVIYGKMIGVDKPNVEITFRLR